jgi:hypothetical protein
MSLTNLHTNLPPEIQTEILFRLVLADSRVHDLFLIFDITPYLLASRSALQCWRANRHVILHRVATIELAATETYRRRVRRTWVLARMRALVWLVAYDDSLEREYDQSRLFLHEKFMDANEARWMAQAAWEYEKKRADYWRTFLLRR